MGRERTPSPDLAKLSEAVAKWREQEGGGRGTRIPAELWNEAVRVACVDGVWWTAKTLRFQYEHLKRRIERVDGGEIRPMKPARANGERSNQRSSRTGTKRRRARTSSRSRAPDQQSNAFVELSAAPLLGAPSATGTVVEVEDKAGTRMTVRLAKEAAVDVAQLVSAFRRRGA